MSGMNNEVLQIVRTKSWIYFEPPRVKTKNKKQSKPIESQLTKEHQNEHFKQ